MLDYQRFREIGDLFACGKVERARRLLMEMQSRCLALRDEIAMLKCRITELEACLDLARNVYEEHGFYWLKSNGLRQGPFCPRCYESDGILIRVEKQSSKRFCPYCGEVFELDNRSRISSSGHSAKILLFERGGRQA